MNALKILQTKNIDPNKPVLMISRSDALESLIEAVKEYCDQRDVQKRLGNIN